MEDKMIYKRMIGIMNEIDAIGKNKTNVQQNYKFRGIDDMYNALQPLFKKHGVFILSEVLAEHREERITKGGGTLFNVVLDMKFSFCTEDGSSVSSTVKGEAMDSSDKATNKAMSTALKYALMQTFLIPTEELEDLNTEKHSPEPEGKKPDQATEQRVADFIIQIKALTNRDEYTKLWKSAGLYNFSESDKKLVLSEFETIANIIKSKEMGV